jgi:hypothetical protein
MTIYNRFIFHCTLKFELQLVLEVDSVSFQFAMFDGLIDSCIFLALEVHESTDAELQKVKRYLKEQQVNKLKSL